MKSYADMTAPHGYFPGTRIPRKRPAAEFEGRGQCKHCGTPGLIWEMHGKAWVLFDMGGKKHVCPSGAR